MVYPFTPEVLDAIPEAIAELYRGLEIVLLREIAKRLRMAGELNEVTVQDIRALRAQGYDLDEIKKAIRRTAGVSEAELDRLLDEVVARNQRYYAGVVSLEDITAPEIIVGAAEIDAIKRQTLGELRNITQSMGFMVGQVRLPPAKAYQWALDNALLQVESGAVSYGQAAANATRALADSGLQYVQYESGWRNQVDVAVRRAVMTGVNQINRKYDEQAMENLETDLVEVSAHAGARDKGVGFQNHKSWQGKVYRWAEMTERFPGSSTGQYPDFVTTCGLGDVQGILGANCRHKWVPFVEGVMERTYTDEQLEGIDKPPFEYEGKTFTTYEATQFQRQIEAAVRHWKRREAAAVTNEDRLAAGARVRALKRKYKEFSDVAGLRMQPERMAVWDLKKQG